MWYISKNIRLFSWIPSVKGFVSWGLMPDKYVLVFSHQPSFSPQYVDFPTAFGQIFEFLKEFRGPVPILLLLYMGGLSKCNYSLQVLQEQVLVSSSTIALLSHIKLWGQRATSKCSLLEILYHHMFT